MKFNIDTRATVGFTNALEKLHRSALPSAVRGTLNKAAIDVKQNTMPAEANKVFEKRSPNFFKANSKFDPAKGFDISSMKSMVGFVPTNLKGRNNHAVEDLQQQEEGGTITNKSFIPLTKITPNARIGGKKNVRANARLSEIKKILDIRKMTGKNEKEKFILAAITVGVGGFVLSKKILWRIDAFYSDMKKKNMVVKKTALYSYKQGRSVQINKATHFMKNASEASAKRMPDFYSIEATRQLKKFGKI